MATADGPRTLSPANAVKWSVSCLVLGLASIHFRWLALPGLFLTLLVNVLGTANSAGVYKRSSQLAVAVGTLGTLAGLFRFVRLDAVPGIVQGGEQAVMIQAVSHLREILRVEDAIRDSADIDPDGDGHGSAAFIGELSGSAIARYGHIDRPPLNRRFQTTKDTPLGKAAMIDGYYFAVCLPTKAGTYSAISSTEIDDEMSERKFIAYAWPEASTRNTFAIDANDEILTRPPSVLGRPTYYGQLHPPNCSVATSDRESDGWKPWRGKKPRAARVKNQ